MASGLVVALEAAREAPYAVLETDESYLGPVTQAARPRAIALLNLSRDYLERGVRCKPLARHWRETLAAVDWPLTVVANADDPIVWAVRGAKDVVWVAGGDRWSEDGAICRDCIVRLRRDGERWWCESCGQERPEPDWRLVGDVAEGPGISIPLKLTVPGRMNKHNAVFALVAATALGVDPTRQRGRWPRWATLTAATTAATWTDAGAAHPRQEPRELAGVDRHRGRVWRRAGLPSDRARRLQLEGREPGLGRAAGAPGRARRGRHRPPRIRHGAPPRGGRPQREAGSAIRSRRSSPARRGRSR